MKNMKCSVVNCENHYSKRRGLSFFRFPRDAELRKIWADVTGRPDYKPNDRNVVCEEHFTDDDVDWSLGRPSLQKGAVPSLNIPEEPNVRIIHTRKCFSRGKVLQRLVEPGEYRKNKAQMVIIEAVVCTWIQRTRLKYHLNNKSIIISDYEINEISIAVAMLIGVANFSPSIKWLQSFRKKHSPFNLDPTMYSNARGSLNIVDILLEIKNAETDLGSPPLFKSIREVLEFSCASLEDASYAFSGNTGQQIQSNPIYCCLPREQFVLSQDEDNETNDSQVFTISDEIAEALNKNSNIDKVTEKNELAFINTVTVEPNGKSNIDELQLLKTCDKMSMAPINNGNTYKIYKITKKDGLTFINTVDVESDRNSIIDNVHLKKQIQGLTKFGKVTVASIKNSNIDKICTSNKNNGLTLPEGPDGNKNIDKDCKANQLPVLKKYGKISIAQNNNSNIDKIYTTSKIDGPIFNNAVAVETDDRTQLPVLKKYGKISVPSNNNPNIDRIYTISSNDEFTVNNAVTVEHNGNTNINQDCATNQLPILKKYGKMPVASIKNSSVDRIYTINQNNGLTVNSTVGVGSEGNTNIDHDCETNPIPVLKKFGKTYGAANKNSNTDRKYIISAENGLSVNNTVLGPDINTNIDKDHGTKQLEGLTKLCKVTVASIKNSIVEHGITQFQVLKKGDKMSIVPITNLNIGKIHTISENDGLTLNNTMAAGSGGNTNTNKQNDKHESIIINTGAVRPNRISALQKSHERREINALTLQLVQNIAAGKNHEKKDERIPRNRVIVKHTINPIVEYQQKAKVIILETVVFLWIQRSRSQGHFVHDPQIRHIALAVSMLIEMTDFIPKMSWVQSFKIKYKAVTEPISPGESYLGPLNVVDILFEIKNAKTDLGYPLLWQYIQKQLEITCKSNCAASNKFFGKKSEEPQSNSSSSANISPKFQTILENENSYIPSCGTAGIETLAQKIHNKNNDEIITNEVAAEPIINSHIGENSNKNKRYELNNARTTTFRPCETYSIRQDLQNTNTVALRRVDEHFDINKRCKFQHKENMILDPHVNDKDTVETNKIIEILSESDDDENSREPKDFDEYQTERNECCVTKENIEMEALSNHSTSPLLTPTYSGYCQNNRTVDLNDDDIIVEPEEQMYNSLNKQVKSKSVTSYADALKNLGHLEEFVLRKNNNKALVIINQLEKIFVERISLHE